LAACLSPLPVRAGYPEKPITIIATFPAGGPVEIAAKALAEASAKYLPQPIAVTVVAGAGGSAGTAKVLQAAPDGYTLGATAVGALTTQPHLLKLPYGPPADYTPIINLIDNPLCLLVRHDSPITGVQELIAAARARPGQFRLGNHDPGSLAHLSTIQLGRLAGIQVQSVNFVGGPEALEALLEGKLDALIQHHGLVFPRVKAGQARVLGVLEEKRSAIFPGAPTLRELGYDLTLAGYVMIIGPKGISPSLRAQLHDAFKGAMDDQRFQEPMKARAFDIRYQGPDELQSRLSKDYATNAELLKAVGLTK
jgi:tripartite-type tricarboxylate transporter receptor subunit TctC